MFISYNKVIFLYCSDESMLKTCLINCCCLPFQAQPMRTIHLPILRSRKGVGVVYLFGLQSLRMVALASIQLRAKEENAREITVFYLAILPLAHSKVISLASITRLQTLCSLLNVFVSKVIVSIGGSWLSCKQSLPREKVALE